MCRSMCTAAALFFEQDLPPQETPLMLETVQNRPVLFWMGRRMAELGVRRFFVAAPEIHLLCTLYFVTLYLNPVHNYLDIVRFIAVELHALHDFLHLAVHANMNKAFLANGFEQLLVMTLSAANHRSQKHDFLSCVFTNDEV